MIRKGLCIAVAASLVGCSAEPATQTFDVAPALPEVNLGDADAGSGTVIETAQRQELVSIERVWLGVEGVPESMMGGKASASDTEFGWAVPETGWRLDVNVVQSGAGAPVSVPVIEAEAPGGSWIALDAAALKDGKWTKESDTWSRWSATVAGKLLQPGAYRLRAKVGSVAGGTVQLHVAVRDAKLDPFDEIDHWLVTFDRDEGHVQVAWSDKAGFVVQAEPKPDGTPDWIEALREIGLQGGDAGWNSAFRDQLRQRMRGYLREFFKLDSKTGAIIEGSVRLQIHFDGDDPKAWEGAKMLSRMAIGGDAPVINGKQTLFGRAAFDPRNLQANDDTAKGYGVFTTSMLRTILGNPLSAGLVTDIAPAVAGAKPLGSLPGDKAFVSDGFDPKAFTEVEQGKRAELFDLAMRFLSLGLAAVTAHEMGHSLGLVAPGYPPVGMLAGVKGPWADSVQEGYHLDTPGPNLMQNAAGFNVIDALTKTPFFAPVEIGYLRGRLLLLSK